MKHIPCDSNTEHLTGKSVFTADMDVKHQLVGKVVTSPYASAKIKSFNLSAAKKSPGVFAVLSAQDIPGENQMGAIIHDEPCLADAEVNFVGQAVFLIAAETQEQADDAANLIEVEYEVLPAITSLRQAMKSGVLLQPSREIKTGNVDKVLPKCDLKIEGELFAKGQEHWYLETQSALAIPGEADEIMLYCSTQHPSENQVVVAEVLGLDSNKVTVEVKRMGGAFGGKESQSNHYAAWSALLAYASGRAVKIVLFRDDDQKMTGKRHPFIANYSAGFDVDGHILALDVEINIDGGATTDLSMAILERALFHIDNAYSIPNLAVVGKAWKTNLPSNTAFRGFGGPQGIAIIENIFEQAAKKFNVDATKLRIQNLYREAPFNKTHFGQEVILNRLPLIFSTLLKDSDYDNRVEKVKEFNKNNHYKKRGIATTPVKFGISFTSAFLNQAGALVHIYKDGSIQVNHGGTEMGQGLNTKMRIIAAKTLGVDVKRVLVTPTNTSKVPNTSATAASSGTDLNGKAVENAVLAIKKRLAKFAVKLLSETNKNEIAFENICFEDEMIFDKNFPKEKIDFNSLVGKAYFNRIGLSSTGFYATPGISYDREKGRGNPFFYFVYGLAISEVELDVFTGNHTLLQTDILHDAGDSINPRLDIGQIQGAFVQGMGWCTCEDLVFDNSGNLLSDSPATYKIPAFADIPQIFNVNLLENCPHPDTIRKSKAIGEPPFVYGISVWLALKNAILAKNPNMAEEKFTLPATKEVILRALW